ncbi:MAG: primosomal protein N', partial [Candidatus Dormibacteraeota bacterium]|nr:primosomal protein N' [Candidatus Dormibacteraeota bacterium]
SYTYGVPPELDSVVLPGVRVEIPFGTRSLRGIVIATQNDTDFADVRPISEVLDERPLLVPHHVALAMRIAERYCAPLPEVIKAMVPKGVRSARVTGRRRGPRTQSRAVAEARGEQPLSLPPPLSPAQQTAAAPLLDAIARHEHRRVLLHGVTGSGKTEVYLTAISAALAAGRGAIVLVPEIALTPQMIRRFAERFPLRVAVVHSALTDAERAAEWRRIRDGELDVVVGSRSAVFAPLENLGIVVVDEEDAQAYKQDRVPRYHAVDTALLLGELANAPVVLGSATPRVETFYRAHTGDLELVPLPQRVTGRALPPIDVVDLREELRAGNTSPLSHELRSALQHCHDDGGQSILFLNRRGTATVVLCRACGAALTCSNCSVSLVHHAERHRCDCHYCGLSMALPTVCPACGSRAIRGLGMGTEALEREVREAFPQLRLLRMDRDTTRSRDAYFDIYERFRAHDADCLIGTQMVAKGWDLGNVRLVGIVNADTSLHFPDYRSGEITFSLLTQVAGRAGRGDEPARVILQTYSPGHYAIEHATTHDYLGFAHDEIRVRRNLQFPPYARLCVCTFSHRSDGTAEREARQECERLSATLGHGDGLDVLGPTPAFLHRLRGEYRWQITVRGTAIERAFSHLPRGRGWIIDVDPSA